MRKAIRIFGIRSISVTVSDARALRHARGTNYFGNRPGCLQSLTRKCPTRAWSAACTHIHVHDAAYMHMYVHEAVAVNTSVAQAKTSTVMPFRFSFYLLNVSLHILYHSIKIPLVRKSVRGNVCCFRSYIFLIFSLAKIIRKTVYRIVAIKKATFHERQ